MTTIPLTVLDNFFDNPDTLRDWGLSLEYKPDPDGRWPGKRSQQLDQIHPPLYNFISKKILSLFFDSCDNLNYHIDLVFQLIENHQGSGWIHSDDDVFTFLIYLQKSDPKIDCGTTFWSLNKNQIHFFNNSQDIENSRSRNSYHLNKSPDIKAQEDFHRNFTKEISIPDKFNRLIAFSSEKFHSANNFNNNTSLTHGGAIQINHRIC